MSKALNSDTEKEPVRSLKVLVAGTYAISDAYPNVKYRIEALKQDPTLEVKELQFGSSTQLDYKSKRWKLLGLIKMAFKQFLRSFRCVVAIINNRRYGVLYLPYPAIPVLALLSFFPRQVMPRRIVIDSFISLYDTVVLDRRLTAEHGVPAKLVYFLERRALKTANAVVTDTPESSEHIRRLFNLSPDTFHDLPLAINEHVYKASPPLTISSSRSCRILFVGTLVPLHRIDILLKAISQLTPSRSVEVIFIGDGQQAGLLETFIKNKHYEYNLIKIVWIREWLSSDKIAQHIRDANLCIGIMGSDGKSGRVWPFKNYLYMACGRTLITAKTTVTDRMTAKLNYDPFLVVNTSDISELSKQLQGYVDEPGQYDHIGSNAEKYFNQYLSSEVHAVRFRKILT